MGSVVELITAFGGRQGFDVIFQEHDPAILASLIHLKG
jgi:hypothetical protein